MGICPGKYICMDQSSNKGIYKDYVKEVLQIILSETDGSECSSSAHAYFMNSTVGEKQKAKAKQIYHLQQEIDTYGSWYCTRTTQSLKAWAMTMQNPTISSCTGPKPNLGKEHFDMKIMMNPDEDHHEHNNILMFIRDQNVCPEFQVKACGTQDTWHNTIGHPTTAI
ncbi:hypothetical protein MTR_0047s0140 [Medicago truncatula]|uniref:Uncharacterized protein n=1 Tax=Medicago truncatula TaxID=3880 RepID=A0A072THP8_MEDTR|nr:hypothetical protein MTR_0047s0140 [Medicago truncatula]